jgi:hypothetical protein
MPLGSALCSNIPYFIKIKSSYFLGKKLISTSPEIPEIGLITKSEGLLSRLITIFHQQ